MKRPFKLFCGGGGEGFSMYSLEDETEFTRNMARALFLELVGTVPALMVHKDGLALEPEQLTDELNIDRGVLDKIIEKRMEINAIAGEIEELMRRT